jgi:hypothetical protein
VNQVSISESAVVGVRLLVSQLRALQRAHRAGITPHYGQLEDLFETTDVVERQIDASAAGASVTPCAFAGCPLTGVSEVQPGRRMCGFHADMFAQLVGEAS